MKRIIFCYFAFFLLSVPQTYTQDVTPSVPVDTIPPVAICDAIIYISLDSMEIFRMYAATVDNGSYDLVSDLHDISSAVQLSFSPCHQQDFVELCEHNFAPNGEGKHELILYVSDNAGNQNSVMTEIYLK